MENFNVCIGEMIGGKQREITKEFKEAKPSLTIYLLPVGFGGCGCCCFGGAAAGRSTLGGCGVAFLSGFGCVMSKA